MGLFDFLKPKKKRTSLAEVDGNLLSQQQKALFEAMIRMCEDGCDADEIPGGQGEFGHSVNNPIPTRTPMGSASYLAQLRAPDGAKVRYERQGSVSSPISTNPIDMYAIIHPSGDFIATLYVSPYHKRNSSKAPRGFSLL